jgi:hypothetical protein
VQQRQSGGEDRLKKPTLKSLKNKAWKTVSEYVRRRDADEGGTVACYTCGGLYFWKELHAGHGIPGRNNAVLFDVDIIKPQCPRDNLFMGGRYEIFAAKLIREHGLEWFEEKLAGARQAVKLTRTDLEQIIEKYKTKLKELELEPA